MDGVLKMSVAYLERMRSSSDPRDKVYVTKFLVDHLGERYSVVLVGNSRGIASRLMNHDDADRLYEYVTSKKRFLLANRHAAWKEVPVAMSQKFGDLQSAMFDRYEAKDTRRLAVSAGFQARRGG